jgi:hypothetical protein
VHVLQVNPDSLECGITKQVNSKAIGQGITIFDSPMNYVCRMMLAFSKNSKNWTESVPPPWRSISGGKLKSVHSLSQTPTISQQTTATAQNYGSKICFSNPALHAASETKCLKIAAPKVQSKAIQTPECSHDISIPIADRGGSDDLCLPGLK